MTAPLGIAHFTTIKVPPTDFARMAARIGYSAIGLRLNPAFPGAPTYEIGVGTAAMRDMKSILKTEGTGVHDIEFLVIDGTFVPESFLKTLESAGELSAKRLSVCGDDADGARLRSNIARLADLAQPFGIGIDIENMPWRKISTFSQAVALAKDCGAPNVSALVDALHFTRGGAVPGDLKAIAPEFVKSFQLCDAASARPATNDALIAEARGGRRLPGEGTLPLVELLDAAPNDCSLSVEVPLTTGTAEEHARAVFDAAQNIIARSSVRRNI